LLKFYAEKFNKQHGKRIEKIPRQLMKALETYDWPGNVRELINVIERAIIVSDGPELKLPEEIDAMPFDLQKETTNIEQRPNARGLSVVEREFILATLQETDWKIEGDEGAAQILGLNPSTLRARMRKLAIKRPKSR
jgi:DNA-binding NtrC family response regulator